MTPQELKNSILQLAIQGKLVEQRPEEGTAEELYREIQKEKQALIKAGKIKKEKPLPEITEEEKTFELPENWVWVRLSDLCYQISDGTHKTPAYVETGIPFLSVKDISSGYLDFSNTRFISPDEHNSLIGRCKPEKDDVLICRIGTLGKAVKIDAEVEFSIFVSLGLIKLVNKAIADYIVLAINSGYGWSWIQRVKVGGGTHTFKINLDDLRLMPIPLPPLDEQLRIREKCVAFSTDFNRYEKAWTRLEEFNKRFPGDMQKSILQMAIQGKLVEQRPEEGTGEELYREIQKEKQALIKAGELKKTKALPLITDDVLPYSFPASWKICYIDDIAFVTKLAGFEYTKYIAPNLAESGIPLFKGKNVQNGQIILDFESYIPDSISDELPRSQIRKKCLLTPYVGTIGNIAIFNGTFRAHLGSNVGKIELLNSSEMHVLEEYLLYYLRSAFGYAELTKFKKATAQESISIDAIRNVIVPLPPLAEQKRIVARLEELLPLCEKLK